LRRQPVMNGAGDFSGRRGFISPHGNIERASPDGDWSGLSIERTGMNMKKSRGRRLGQRAAAGAQ